MRNGCVIALQNGLVQAEALGESPQRGLEPSSVMIELRVVLAFVVDAADLQSNPEIPGFVQPDVLVFEADRAELCVQRFKSAGKRASPPPEDRKPDGGDNMSRTRR